MQNFPIDIEATQKKLDASFFLYDLDAMELHLRSLSTPGIRLWYACKANPLSRVIDTAAAAGISFDVASEGELRQVLSRNIQGENILLTGPAKSRSFVETALDAGVKTVVLESIEQAKLVEELASARNKKIDVLLRLQLQWGTEEKSVLGGSSTTVFGLDHEGWVRFEKNQYPHLQVRGVHVFQWGNLLDEARIDSIWNRIADEAMKLSVALQFPLEILDLGGGLGIPYSAEKKPLQFSLLQESLQSIRTKSGAKEVWLELGRYAVGQFGIYVTKILEKKTVREKHFLLCEGGAHHLVRPALVGESFPCTASKGGKSLEKFAVHGPLCTALDCLGEFALPGDTKPGDCLIFTQTGAYGFTESMPYFLCHDLPAELVWNKGKLETVREPLKASSWLR